MHKRSILKRGFLLPTISQWFLRLPEILEEFRSLTAPIVDRAVIEAIFRVGRRRAIQLLHQFGGYQVGKTFVVDRAILIAQLETMRDGVSFDHEQQRKTRIIEELEQTRRLRLGRKVRIAAAADVRHRVLKDLPAAIHLQPGELRIEFFGAEDLLRQLFELSQAIANDYKKFQAAVEDPDMNPSPRGSLPV